LLLAHEGESDTTIAKVLHFGRCTVERTRKRFVEGGIDWALNERSRSGGCRKLEFHYTPKHGSLLDMAEVEFSVLSCQCLNRRIPDVEMFQREIAAWEKERNEKQATDARLKLKRLYPS